jgi:hypothetical protein
MRELRIAMHRDETTLLITKLIINILSVDSNGLIN